jgi:uncharacterized membrane protein YkvA (DUF1232 family)
VPPPRRSDAGPPPRPRTTLGTLGALLVALLSAFYVANPGLGALELIPDILPGIGNLDEAGATAALLFALRYLFRSRR